MDLARPQRLTDRQAQQPGLQAEDAAGRGGVAPRPAARGPRDDADPVSRLPGQRRART